MTRRALKGLDGVYVINLKRRADKLQQFRHLSGLRDNEFHVFEAVDGHALVWNAEIDALFRNNTYGSRSGVVGCALSHYRLWQHIASTNDELHLIFEDDAEFVEDWVDKWNNEFYADLPADRFAGNS